MKVLAKVTIERVGVNGPKEAQDEIIKILEDSKKQFKIVEIAAKAIEYK